MHVLVLLRGEVCMLLTLKRTWTLMTFVLCAIRRAEWVVHTKEPAFPDPALSGTLYRDSGCEVVCR